jgi:hypothetical protein
MGSDPEMHSPSGGGSGPSIPPDRPLGHKGAEKGGGRRKGEGKAPQVGCRIPRVKFTYSKT